MRYTILCLLSCSVALNSGFYTQYSDGSWVYFQNDGKTSRVSITNSHDDAFCNNDACSKKFKLDASEIRDVLKCANLCGQHIRDRNGYEVPWIERSSLPERLHGKVTARKILGEIQATCDHELQTCTSVVDARIREEILNKIMDQKSKSGLIDRFDHDVHGPQKIKKYSNNNKLNVTPL